MKRLYSILLVVGSVVLIGFFMIALLVDYAVFSMVGFIGIAIMMLGRVDICGIICICPHLPYPIVNGQK